MKIIHNETITKGIKEALAMKSGIIMEKLPSEIYFQANLITIMYLVQSGYEGIYVSFHRPYKNIVDMLKQQHADPGRLFFVDAAASIAGIAAKAARKCIHMPESITIEGLTSAVHTFIPRMKGSKTFVFIDSLTSLAFYKPDHMPLMKHFAEFLTTLKERGFLIIVNTSQEASKLDYIEELEMFADKFISVKI
jgi:KaiC/GvpD/RAD55 family RecA-like ATPase